MQQIASQRCLIKQKSSIDWSLLDNWNINILTTEGFIPGINGKLNVFKDVQESCNAQFGKTFRSKAQSESSNANSLRIPCLIIIMIGPAANSVHFCPEHREQKNSLMFLCLSPYCSTHTLLCRVCTSQYHHGHDIVELHQLLERTQECTFDRLPAEMSEQLLHQLKSARTEAQHLIGNARDQITQLLKNVDDELMQSINEEEQLARIQAEQLTGAIPLRPNINPNDDVTVLNKEVVKASRALILFNEKKEEVLGVYSRISDSLASKITNLRAMLENIGNIITKYVSSIKKPNSEAPRAPTVRVINQPFPVAVDLTLKKQETAFSTNLHHHDITVSGSRITRERNTTNWYVCALGYSSWRPQQTEVFSCRLKILAKKQRMCMGIVTATVAIDNQFKYINEWEGIGHSHYAIDDTGHTYSHDNEQVNFKEGPVKFAAGDTVEMVLNPKKMTIKFICNGRQSELKLAPLDQRDGYRFVVYFYDKGESIAILNQDE